VPSPIHSRGAAQSAFAPAAAVTGIGSLPLIQATEAINAVAQYSPEIPFWPQLPQSSEGEGAIGQGLAILGHLIEPRQEGYGYQVRAGGIDPVLEILHRSRGELQPASAAGFLAFEQALARGTFRDARAVKGQIEGPITLSAYVFYRDRPFLSDPTLFSAIAFHVSQMVCWQIDRLKSAGLPVLLFLDEPALCLAAASAKTASGDQRLSALAASLDGARVRGALAGLHCCAAQPFDRMFYVRPDILSFDAHAGLEAFLADPRAIGFVRDGGTVAYGLVPTRPAVSLLDSTSIFIRWLNAASRAGDPRELARRSMVTATCGLGLLEPSAIAESFGAVQQISKLIRSLAGGPCYSEGS